MSQLAEFVATLPDQAYALASVVFWAMSVPVVNEGLRHLPQERQPAALIVGITAALVIGTLFLFMLSGPVQVDMLNPAVAIAGLLTFPIATGGYYVAAAMLGERTEVAAQFSKLKPLFSVALAVLLLGETVDQASGTALLLIVAGLALLTFGIARQRLSTKAIAVGLGTALAWAVGELFVKIGFSEGAALQQTFWALAISTLVMLPLALPALHRLRGVPGSARWLIPFGLHGLLSFGLAYAFFFHSITRIGLARSVLIAAFWPVLGIFCTWTADRLRRRRYRLHPAIWTAALLLLAASLIQVSALAH